MSDDLFSKTPIYTIDSSSLMDIFSEDDPLWTSKEVTPGLWARILALINDGTIISHIEVLKEIKTDGKKGIELYDWAQANKHVFKDYRYLSEGKIIRSLSPKYKAFVNAKVSNVHADPWLVAQAKNQKLAIITEEVFTTSPVPARWTIPNICKDSSLEINSLSLLELTKEQSWKFK